MHCPACAAADTSVVDSRVVSEGSQVRRRRECNACRHRFTTYETVDMVLPRVVKRDAQRVAFNENKLRSGLTKALEKRPVSTEDLDVTMARIMSRLRAYSDHEIPSLTLGGWVMDELKALDEVAYVRFASVYRSFQDISEFQEEINRLKKNYTE